MEWRVLLYPLGLLPTIFFGLRFFVQWIASERAGICTVPRVFWHLSIIGNVLLAMHCLIQVQYPLCLLQSGNAVIAWRNLDLMSLQRPPRPRHWVFSLLALVFIGVTSLFCLQQQWCDDAQDWLRVPLAPWSTSPPPSISWIWTLIGLFGTFLFSARFWLQWWEAEQLQRSILSLAFWWMSLTGALLSIGYFARTQDIVHLVGPLCGIIPFIRNLMLPRASLPHKAL